jgi:hypothetical protein
MSDGPRPARRITASRRRSIAGDWRRSTCVGADGRGCQSDRPHLEQRIIAFSLGHPGYGPRRISAELARETWSGIRISERGVWRVLVRVGLKHPVQASGGDRPRDPYERRPAIPPPGRHIDASEPGRRSSSTALRRPALGIKGIVWQYTAIDLASAHSWAHLHTSQRNPRAAHREQLHRVGRGRRHRRLESPPTTNPSLRMRVPPRRPSRSCAFCAAARRSATGERPYAANRTARAPRTSGYAVTFRRRPSRRMARRRT